MISGVLFSSRVQMALVPKARPREGGRLPTRYRRCRDALAMHFKTARRFMKNELYGALYLDLVIFTAAPKRKPRWMTAMQWADVENGGVALCPVNGPGRGDVDNMAGTVMDALTKAGVWGDDCQVTTLLVHKCVSLMPPEISVSIWHDEPRKRPWPLGQPVGH